MGSRVLLFHLTPHLKSLSSYGSPSSVFLISDSVGCQGLFFFSCLKNDFLPLPNRDSYQNSGEDMQSPDKSRSHGPITGCAEQGSKSQKREAVME